MARRAQFPRQLTSIGGIPILLLLFDFIMQWMPQQSWWPNMWFLYAAILVFIFWSGMLCADLTSDQSKLRRWWSYRNRAFDVVALYTTHTWEDTDKRATERVDIKCRLKLTRDIDQPRLIVRVTTGIEFEEARRTTDVVIDEMIATQIAKDKDYVFVLGSIAIRQSIPRDEQERLRAEGKPIGARHSVWGKEPGGTDIQPGQKTIIRGSRNLIEISLGNQTYKVFALLIPEDREDLRRILILTEDDDWILRQLSRG